MDGRISTGLERPHDGRQQLRQRGEVDTSISQHAAPFQLSGSEPARRQLPAGKLRCSAVLSEAEDEPTGRPLVALHYHLIAGILLRLLTDSKC